MVFPDRRTASVLLTTLFFALALTIVYIARTVIVIFAFSILFAYLINPIVRFLQPSLSVFQKFERAARFGSLFRNDRGDCGAFERSGSSISQKRWPDSLGNPSADEQSFFWGHCLQPRK